MLDDTYGEIVFQAVEWGVLEDGKTFSKREKLESHHCTPEELGVKKSGTGKKATFLPIVKTSLPTLERYHKKFMCFN